MIKKFLALAILVSFGFIANAQTANLILFTENGEQFTAPVHNAKFDIDEPAMQHGVGLFCWMAINALK